MLSTASVRAELTESSHPVPLRFGPPTAGPVESSLPEKPKENMDQVDQVAQCPGGQEGSAPLSFLVV